MTAEENNGRDSMSMSFTLDEDDSEYPGMMTGECWRKMMSE
jgi:hypothetical protein